MIKIKTKYIVLFWIILLFLFTLYCIVKLKYINVKLQEKYGNTPVLTLPQSMHPSNIFEWLKNEEQNNYISTISPECRNVYDDNYEIKKIGYCNCKTAYDDYLAKGFDVNDKFGQKKSLAEICPVTTKTPAYSNCIKKLLFKFTNNSNIVDNVADDMSKSINTRLDDRNAVINDLNNQMKPYLLSKNQTEFKNFMESNNAVAKYSDDVGGLINKYYKNRFNTGYKVGSTIGIESFVNSVGFVDPEIETLFFGYYKPLEGQFLVLNDITISLNYDINISTQTTQGTKTTQKLQTTQKATNTTQPMIDTNSKNQKLILNIINKNGLEIKFNVNKINKFNKLPNAIVLSLDSQSIENNPNDSQTLQHLLSLLGVNDMTYLIITYEEFTSTENILHKNYKLVNQNLDTIVILNKI